MAGQTLLPAITASGASATKVVPPNDGDVEGVNLLSSYANAINDNGDITDDHEKRIGSLEQMPNQNQQFQGYGPITFAFSIGMAGEFEAYTILAQKVGST